MRVTKRNWTVSIIYFVVVILTLVLRIFFSLGLPNYIPMDSNHLFTLCVQVLIFGIVPFFMYTLSQFGFSDGTLSPIKSLAWRFGFTKKVSLKNWLRTVVITFLMMFTATFVSWMWQSVLSALGFVQVSTPTEYTDLGVLFMQLFMVALLPAFFEEFTHRGLIFAGFRTNSLKDGWKLVLLSALLFSFMHQSIRQTGYTFYDGIIMGLLCYYTKSIYPSIFAHFVNNAGAVLSEYSNQHGGFYIFNNAYNWLMSSPLGFAVFMFCAILAIALIIFLFYRMRKDFIKEHADIVVKRKISDGTILEQDGLLELNKMIAQLNGNILGTSITSKKLNESLVIDGENNSLNTERINGQSAIENQYTINNQSTVDNHEILGCGNAESKQELNAKKKYKMLPVNELSLPDDFTKNFEKSQRYRKAVWVYVTLGIGVVCAVLSFVWGMLR